MIVDNLNTNTFNVKKINESANGYFKKKEGVHFYWSQKSADIARQIYTDNCQDNDIVMDPFLGGGSSLLAIRNKNLKFIGIDINELPISLARFNIKKIDHVSIKLIKEQVLLLKDKYSSYYHYKTNTNIELEFEKVVFDDKNEPKIKKIYFQDSENKKFSSDDFPEIINEFLTRWKTYKSNLNQLENPKLTKNSRIAIKDNTYLADIFSPINYSLLTEIKFEIEENDNLKFLFSTILQLCKLTDLKSQSQFPFWLPNYDLVDRNIFSLLLNKVNQLEKLVGQSEIIEVNNFNELTFQINPSCLLFNMPIQEITNSEIPDNSIDFILTDPPYFDQVAYSEYLKIWEHFLGYKSYFEDEIIVSQRLIDKSDEIQYINNLKIAFGIIKNKLKIGKKLYLYFKDSRLDKMFLFLKLMNEIGFDFVGQEFINTGNFTYKQNTTIRTTLNGESILKFVNSELKDEKEEFERETTKSIEKLVKFLLNHI